MQPVHFPTDLPAIQQRLQQIKPLRYAKTRNYINGDVTYLSPYISRGVISLRQVAAVALATHTPYEIEKFLQELAWREYWQRTWQALGDGIFHDIRQPQQGVAHHNRIAAIEQASTGITAIDQHIESLYATGYLHNHLRMYVSSIACNIGQAHWKAQAQWMYYHLLDGDLASNSLSWQWVAGTFSSKKYYCNQENINRYTGSSQQGTWLDQPYEALPGMPIPSSLQQQASNPLVTSLPSTPNPVLDPALPTLLYNSYNLDPHWHAGERCNRILLLEPSHFAQHPVSDKVLQFILALANNITGIQIFAGECSQLQQLQPGGTFIYKAHPVSRHYKGRAESWDDLFPEVTGSFNSFFAYWKKCERYLKRF